MNVTPIPTNRQLPDFHKEVKEITAQVMNQNSTLKEGRRRLLSKVKEIQEKRALTSIRSGYFLRMTSSNVQTFIQLPFMRPDGISISERLVEMSGIGTIRADINRFLKEIYNNREELPEILANLPPAIFNEQLSFLPAGVKPKEFFACSTIPSIFGHHWTVELRVGFINFLMEIVDKFPGSVLSNNFRDSWLFDCIKNYIHVSGIHRFLSISIRELILQFIRDEKLVELSKNQNSAFFDKITDYAEKMIEQMSSHLSIFPADVKLLFKRFIEKCPAEDKLNRIELLFMDGLLIPSVSMPTTYGVIPATYFYDMSLDGPARNLQILGQSLRYILHKNQASFRYPDVDFSRLFQLPLPQLLESFAEVNDNEIKGPKIVEILPILGLHYITMLYSISDILLLGYVIQGSKSTIATNLLNYANKMPVTQPVNFSFFRYEAWDFKVFGIEKPDIPENEIEGPQNTTSSKAAEAIFKMLEYIPTNPNVPNDILGFIKFYEKQNLITKNFVSESYVRHLEIIYNEVPQDQRSMILPALEDEMRRRMAYIARNHKTLVNVYYQIKILDYEADGYQEKLDASIPMLYGQLLNLYLLKNPDVKDDLNCKKALFTIHEGIFEQFFREQMKKLAEIINPIADFALAGVTCHFHTYVMQKVPLKVFKDKNPDLAKIDSAILKNPDTLISSICDDSYDNLKIMFQNPSLFSVAIQLIKNAAIVQLPIEAMNRMTQTVELLNQMFKIEVNSNPNPEELAAMFNYVYLSSKINDIYSFAKYIEFFLIKVPQFEYKFTDEKQKFVMNCLTNLITNMHKIASHL